MAGGFSINKSVADKLLLEDVEAAMRHLEEIERRLRTDLRTASRALDEASTDGTNRRYRKSNDLVYDCTEHWEAVRDVKEELTNSEPRIEVGGFEWDSRVGGWQRDVRKAERFLKEHG